MDIKKTTASLVCEMVRDGFTTERIAERMGVSKAIVAVIEHSIALQENETQLERLHVLARENNLLSQNNLDLKNYAAKQLAKWLIQAGMQPGQIHICTGLSIHKCRHLYQQVREVVDADDAVIPMPQSFAARLVMSIFASHYSYLQELSNSQSIQLSNVIVAWGRTIEEVLNNRLDELEDFDSRFISLGSLFDVARNLREVQMMPGEKTSFADGKRIRKIARSYCANCGSHYVWCVTSRRVKATKCCFCEMTRGAQKALKGAVSAQKSAEDSRMRSETEREETEESEVASPAVLSTGNAPEEKEPENRRNVPPDEEQGLSEGSKTAS